MRSFTSGCGVAAALVLAAACRGTDAAVSPPPTPTDTLPRGSGRPAVRTDLIVVSSPVRVAGEAASRVYVSLSPGAIPDGNRVEITNRDNGADAEADFVDGGFDPVAVTATEGNILSIAVTYATYEATARRRAVVETGSMPLVVRTDPSLGETNVQPATALTVVFSEPVRRPADAASWLSAGERRVRGRLAPTPGSDVSVVFTPDEPLAPATKYGVAFDGSVEALDGRTLDTSGPVAWFYTEGLFGERPNTVTVLVPPYTNGCDPPSPFCEPASTTALTLDDGSPHTFSAPGRIDFPDVPAGRHTVRDVSGHYGGPVICGFWFDDDSQEMSVVLREGKSAVVSLHFECF